MRISLTLSFLALLTGCASDREAAKHVAEQPAVDDQFLVGTWIPSSVYWDEEEVFLPSHAYCAYERSKPFHVVAVGTWEISQPGYVTLRVVQAKNPNRIVSGDTAEGLIVKRLDPNRLWMGASCSDCEDNLA